MRSMPILAIIADEQDKPRLGLMLPGVNSSA